MTFASVKTALLAQAPEDVWRLGVWWKVIGIQLNAGTSRW